MQLPKGRLVFEAIQTDEERAVLSVELETVERQEPAPDSVGEAFQRLTNPLGSLLRTRTVRDVVGASADLAPDDALGLEVGPVTVGDFVSTR